MTEPTMHDQIVTLLTTVVEDIEAAPNPFKIMALRAVAPQSLLDRIRNEQHYDPEVMDLLDRIDNLLSTT